LHPGGEKGEGHSYLTVKQLPGNGEGKKCKGSFQERTMLPPLPENTQSEKRIEERRGGVSIEVKKREGKKPKPFVVDR